MNTILCYWRFSFNILSIQEISLRLFQNYSVVQQWLLIFPRFPSKLLLSKYLLESGLRKRTAESKGPQHVKAFAHCYLTAGPKLPSSTSVLSGSWQSSFLSQPWLVQQPPSVVPLYWFFSDHSETGHLSRCSLAVVMFLLTVASLGCGLWFTGFKRKVLLVPFPQDFPLIENMLFCIQFNYLCHLVLSVSMYLSSLSLSVYHL